jgi:hypothetical protein
MAEFLKKTVKPSGGDYTSLEACLNANEQDLTGDGWFTVEIDGTWSTADATSVVIHNYTCPDANNNIRIATTTASRHLGVYSTSYYVLSRNSSTDQSLSIASNYVSIIGIQINNAVNNGIAYSADGVTLDKLIIKATSYCISMSNHTGSIRNSCLIGERGISSSDAAAAFYAYNCSASASGYGFVRIVCKNCYAGSTGIGYLTLQAGSATNASADTSGTAGLQSIAYSISAGAYFTNVTSGSEDFHIGTSSALKNAGTDLSGTFTDDIDGTTRPTGAGTWDIGADEYVAAAGADVVGFMTPNTGYWGGIAIILLGCLLGILL